MRLSCTVERDTGASHHLLHVWLRLRDPKHVEPCNMSNVRYVVERRREREHRHWSTTTCRQTSRHADARTIRSQQFYATPGSRRRRRKLQGRAESRQSARGVFTHLCLFLPPHIRLTLFSSTLTTGSGSNTRCPCATSPGASAASYLWLRPDMGMHDVSKREQPRSWDVPVVQRSTGMSTS